MKLQYRTIEKSIGYRFKKKEHLELALTHPSFRYENDAVLDDNQRLEYLGDAVLSLISAEYLFENSPNAREGQMSKLRSRLTEDRKLSEIGAILGIGPFLLLGHGEKQSGGAERASNLADAVEAIIGAAWIDGGMRAVHKIFKQVFVPVLEALSTLSIQNNPKGALQEYAQRNGISVPCYQTVNTEGPEHSPIFTIEVSMGDKVWSAVAHSKREAERLAAFTALNELPMDLVSSVENFDDSIPVSDALE